MQTAPELIFHDVGRSAWVENYILERVRRLDRFADGITSCRVPTQLPALINLAFGAIERQLKKTAELRRGEVKNQEQRHGGQPHGVVEKLFDEGYGFLRALDDDRQVYFHRNSVLHGDFERLAIGTAVRFTPQDGEQGPQASSVQIVAKPGALAQKVSS